MARSQPITWQNVGINDGSSAASLGNTAANFGSAAIQGLDIFSSQMQDRVNREDTLLTNEAIGAALNGGPQVSGNRRVDATTLQAAVEAKALGQRQESLLQDNLLSSAVDRRLNTASAGVKEKELENYDEAFALDKQIAESEASYRETQSEVARAGLEELKRKRAEVEADRVAFAGVNAELFGPQAQQKATAEHEAYWAENAPANATPADKALDQKQWLENAQQEVFNNPRMLQEMALKYGTTPKKLAEGTWIGQRATAAIQASDAILAERAILSKEQQDATLKGAQLYEAGNEDYLRFDGEKYVYEKDTASNDATFESAFADTKVDPKSDRAVAFKNKIKANFKSGSVSEQIIKELVRDGEIPENFSALVDGRAADLKQQAVDLRSAVDYGGSSDRRVNADNYYRSIEDRLPKETTAEEAGDALIDNPIVAAAAIQSINTNPTTVAEKDEAKAALKVSVDGLLKAREEITIPEDASNKLRALYNRFRSQVDVANGGQFIPETPTIGIMDVGISTRPETPRFNIKKDYAVDAATTLKQLQQQIEKEQKEAQAARLRKELDE